MAILRSIDGRFYEVPDESLDQYEVPADQVKQKLSESGEPLPAGPPPGGFGPEGGPMGGMGPGGLVYVQVFTQGQGQGRGGPPGRGARPAAAGAGAGEVQPYNYCGGGTPPWRNCWRNCWRNYCPGR